MLKTQGFVHSIAFPGVTAHPVLSQQQIFVAQVAAETSKRKPSRWLIVPDATGFAPVLMQSLTAAGDVAELLPAAPGDGLTDQLRDALASNPPVRGVVHLSALDAGIDEATDASALMLRQRISSNRRSPRYRRWCHTLARVRRDFGWLPGAHSMCRALRH